MKIKNISILLFFAFISSCTDKVEKRDLIVKNESNDIIYAIVSENENMASSAYYNEFRNESSYDNTDTIFHFRFHPIKPKSSSYSTDKPKSWISFFERAKEAKLHVFIISNDTVEKYGWHDVFNEQRYSKLIKIGLEDLNLNEWCITYNSKPNNNTLSIE